VRWHAHALGEIRDIFRATGSDKTTDHAYEHIIDLIYPHVADAIENVESPCILEIGYGPSDYYSVGGGGLLAFDRIFPGCDLISIDRQFPDPPQETIITKIIADTGDDAAVRSVAGKLFGRNVVLVVDDGSHLSAHQRRCFREFWPFVVPGGIYIIEDIWEPQSLPHYDKNAGMMLVDLRHIKGRGDDMVFLARKTQ
jgi:hypothetical protein